MSETRYVYIDFLKFVSFLLIIFLHTFATIGIGVFNGEGGESETWRCIILLNATTRFSVPIFILCSGAMILRKDTDDFAEFFRRRFSKIVIPYLFWGLIYEFSKGVTDIYIILKDFLSMDVYYHFWFVYMILIVYLFVPILSGTLNNFNQSKLNYTLALWLCFSVHVSLKYLLSPYEFYDIVKIYAFPEFIGYFIAGWMIHNEKIKFPRLNGVTTFAIVSSIIGLLAYLVIFYSIELSRFYEGVFEPYFIAVAIGSLLIFKYCREHEDYFQRHFKFTVKFSGLTYGGYLLHALILNYVINFLASGSDFVQNHTIIFCFVCAGLTGILTLSIIKIFSLIPILRRFI